MTRLAAATFACVIVVTSACSKSPAPGADAAPSATAPAPASASPSPDVEAADTVAALRGGYQPACECAMADNAWTACHDETKGFERVLKCAQDARAKANAAKAKLPPTSARSSTCGKAVEQATSAMVTASAAMFDDLVVWLEKNKARLAGALAKESLTDACGRLDCQQEVPSSLMKKYEVASYITVSSIECTKPLFQCGRAKDNVCWINKVADRLGLACDPAANKVDDPLFVRATGKPVR